MSVCVMPRHGDRPAAADWPAQLCGPCRTHLRNRIAALPALSAWLDHHVARSGGGGGLEPVAGSREPPAPPRLDVLDLHARIYHVTAAWSRLVFTEHEPEVRFPASNILGGLCEFLVRHLDWVAMQPWVDEMAAEVGELHSDAWKLAPRYRRRVRLDGQPCPVCDLCALVLDGPDLPRRGRDPLDRHVECEVKAGGCGTIWLPGEMDWLAHVVTGGAA